MWVFIGGFVVHLIFLASMFDIYFKTPIVPGISSIPNPIPGPAKRVVFIVADGLRADSFYNNDKNSTPFLRSKIEHFGSWGVSHTRVPTESRPGVVALAAGIYEDPSAVFRGWKENPAEFDTLFNQSHHTWAWGSPDIVKMFTLDNVDTMSYKQEDEEFFGKHSSWKLDSWVFDHVAMLLESSKDNVSLYDMLHQDKLVFFLHLLGLDTAGHTIKPNAGKYQENLYVVDSGIKVVEELFESFYRDRMTAFVFTADHGMTDWGSHGAGSKDETEVPLLVWGRGIKEPRSADPWDPPSPNSWQLGHLKRKDVQQADIVTLLASVIGCSIPVNSVGRLPRSYLDLSVEHVTKLTFYNALQLSAQANRKQELVQSRSSWLFKPYWKLSHEYAKTRIQMIQKFIMSKEYDTAIQLSEELVELSIDALHYYHNYYQGLLLTSTSLSFLGWIAWLLCQLDLQFGQDCPTPKKRNQNDSRGVYDVLFLVLAVVVFLFTQVQGLDFQFSLYFLLPIFLWWKVSRAADEWLPFVGSRKSCMKLFAVSILLLIFVEIMVVMFFERWILSVGILTCALLPLSSMNKFSRVPPKLLVAWLLSCAAVAVFPLLPVIGSETFTLLVAIAGVLWIFFITMILNWLYGPTIWWDRILIGQLLWTVCTIFVVTWAANAIEIGRGLPVVCRVFSWITLFISPLTSMCGQRTVPLRLSRILLALLPPYLLLSVRHEVLFLLALSLNLLCWLQLEAQLDRINIHQIKRIHFPGPAWMEKSSVRLSADHFRRAALFVFYVFLSFFGTGNIASLNTFEITWVRCFVSVFSPFTMMILILFKLIAPFLIVSSVFRAVNISLQAPTSSMFIVVLVVCDLMGLQFLHLVTNEGSWLDIGTSISHFVIVQVTVLALVLLYGIASILTGTDLFDDVKYLVRLWRRKLHSKQES